jgi:hypothetical protein
MNFYVKYLRSTYICFTELDSCTLYKLQPSFFVLKYCTCGTICFFVNYCADTYSQETIKCDIWCHSFIIYYAVVMSVHLLASRVIDQTHP